MSKRDFSKCKTFVEVLANFWNPLAPNPEQALADYTEREPWCSICEATEDGCQCSMPDLD